MICDFCKNATTNGCEHCNPPAVHLTIPRGFPYDPVYTKMADPQLAHIEELLTEILTLFKEMMNLQFGGSKL